MRVNDPIIYVPLEWVRYCWQKAEEYEDRRKSGAWRPPGSHRAANIRLDAFGFCGQWATAEYLGFEFDIEVHAGGDRGIDGTLADDRTIDAKWTEKNSGEFNLLYHPDRFLADVTMLSNTPNDEALRSTKGPIVRLPKLPPEGLAIRLVGWVEREVFERERVRRFLRSIGEERDCYNQAKLKPAADLRDAIQQPALLE